MNPTTPHRAHTLGLLCLLLFAAALPAFGAPAYDPLAPVTPPAEPAALDLTVHDAARGRDVPLRVYLPGAKTAAPVVLYSHGLGGSRATSAFLGRHWAARGYVAVFLQHPGSDEAVWKDAPAGEGLLAMRQAVNLQNFEWRVGDVHAVLDQLAAWEKTAGHPLAGRMDLDRVGMSGHSFGAVTTQAVSGQHLGLGPVPTDARIKAALIMSPSQPPLSSPEEAFGEVKLPWMLMTGSEDVSPFGLGHTDVASRRAVYAALPPGGKYELVLDRAEHSAFVENVLPGEHEPHNLNHHRAILALSTAFWDAYLRGDADARAWLDGDGPRTVLAPADQWRRK